ncbi:uncharacterized protein LOC128181455 [Crassostrea angulata]|uniref:uncharacterized protein LOC128181455 n=1 Tax=Magallana angulata TaxID=2784310 RepID=UPI0022B1ACF6|nr:uncharacterized protein LOC128181455 [Crassostrea angulata]
MSLRGVLSLFLCIHGYRPVAMQEENSNSTAITLDELVNGFRFQQLQLSTTMMNASIHARLPEKLAAAEAKEADQREAKASRAYHEAKTPFIATTSRYNLGYIGRGYDLFKGNPLTDDGVVDQGFRLPIIELPYTHKFTADGNYRIPDNVDVISESSAKFGSSLHTVQSESDYKKMLSVDASVNAHGGGWGGSASFSASASYQKNSREIQKGETTTLNVVSRAVVYRARMSETSKLSKVNDYFEKAVMLLPMEDCESGPLQEMYINLVREFGTHYTTEVVMGAKAVQQLTFSKSDLSKLESEGISAKVAAQASFSGFGASGGGGLSVGVSSKDEAFNRVQNTSKEQYEYYIGGNPPSGDISKGTTESLREWARSADEKPVPIQYKMSSIESLLRPGYFKDITYGLFERRHCLRSAIYAYCKQTSSPSLCSPPNEASLGSRRKRQTDNAPVGGIKFGDFVSLSNVKSKQYLSLSNSTGYLRGIVTKPLVPVTTFSDYNGLFQIKSSDDDSTTVGTPLVYGQVFKLVTVKGDNLLTGKALFNDVNNAPTDKLMDAFDNKDGLKYSSPGDLSGMSIFLRSDKEKPYLISLQLSICGSPKDVFQVQINLEGSEGTVVFPVKHQCQHRYGHKWYYSAFTDRFIGEPKKFYFMSSTGTEKITGIQIKTSNKRGIISYTNKSLNCVGNQQTVNIASDEIRPIKQEYDIYPTQFSLLSKNYPIGSFVRRRDTVFVEVVSAIERESFWGKPATHLLSHKNDTITLEEKTPVPHKQISGCSDIIYPGFEGLSFMTSVGEKYFVSFTVEVMITTVTISTKKPYQAEMLRVEYINRNSSKFQILQNFIKSPGSGSITKLELKFPAMYLTSVKVYFDSAADFPQNIDSFLVSGCPAALLEKEPQDTKAEEWNLKLSENEIQTYPYLSVITTQYNGSNFDSIFADFERPFTVNDYKAVITIDRNKRGCMIDEDYIQNYLMTTDEIEGLKFGNTRVSLSQNSVSVTTSVTAMNKVMYDQNMPAFDSILRMAVQQFPCNDGRLTPAFALHRSSEESGLSSVAKAVIAVLGIIAACAFILAIIAFVRFRQIKKASLEEGSRRLVDANVYGGEPRTDESLFTNKAFDDTQGGHTGAPSILPPRQRRLT